jgi:hypothetical protein
MSASTPTSRHERLLAIDLNRTPTKDRHNYGTKENEDTDLPKHLLNALAGLSHHFLQPACNQALTEPFSSKAAVLAPGKQSCATVPRASA